MKTPTILISSVFCMLVSVVQTRPEVLDRDPRISQIRGGSRAEMTEFPFAAEVLLPGGDNQIGIGPDEGGSCSGSLIAPNWVLTAAHCLNEQDIRQSVIAIMFDWDTVPSGGTPFVKGSEIQQVFLHPDEEIDLGLIQFQTESYRPILYEPIRLASPDEEEGFFNEPDPDRATVLGRGRTRQNDPASGGEWRYVQLDVARAGTPSPQLCSGQTKVALICGGGPTKGILEGDSGGPLIIQEDGKWKQIGVTSYFNPSGPQRSYFYRTSYAWDWLTEHIPELAETSPPSDPPPSGSYSHELLFPHIGIGQGMTSDLIMFSPAESKMTIHGRIRFHDDDGEDLHLIPSENSEFSLEPNEFKVFSPVPGSALQVGSARVESTAPLTGFIRFRVPGIGMATIESPRLATKARFPISSLDLRTGFALRIHRSASTANIQFWFVSPDGRKRLKVNTYGLGPQYHVSNFVHEVYDPNFLGDTFYRTLGVHPEDFTGWFEVHARFGSLFSLVALEMGDNPGEFSGIPIHVLE